MAFSLNRLKDVGLVVYDLDSVLPFYEDLLEAKAEIVAMGTKLAEKAIMRARAMYRVATLTTENTVLRLIEYGEPSLEGDEVSSYPICFEVDNIEDAYRKLNDKGIPYHTGAIEFSDSHPPHIQHQWAYFNDPEGNLLQIKEMDS